MTDRSGFDVTDLRAVLRGTALLPGEPGYDAARTVWNAMVDKRPAVIVRCTGAADVTVAVDFALNSGLPISIRAAVTAPRGERFARAA